MRRIESQIDTNAADFKANYAAMSERSERVPRPPDRRRVSNARNVTSTALPGRTSWACASG